MALKKSSLVILPALLLVIYFCAGWLYPAKFAVFIKPLLIPLFIIYALSVNFVKIKWNYLAFVFFFYVAETLLICFENNYFVMRFALFASFISYVLIINLAYDIISYKNLKMISEVFSIIIIGINILFLAGVVYLLIVVINDQVLNVIMIFNALAALCLTITSVLYLSIKNNRESQLYFFGSLTIIFSDVFAAMNAYYIDLPLFNLIERLLHFFGFYLIYLFVISLNSTTENENFAN